MRKNIVAGNWKMNCTLPEGKKLASEVIHMVEDEVNNDAEVILIPPFIQLTSIHSLIGSSKVLLGAQNCHQNQSGAFTGEVSAAMLVSTGATHVILGHSERREYFGETDQLLAEKVEFVLKNNLTPIFCCGEKLEVREANNHEKLVREQVEKALFNLSAEQIKKVVIAYEPVWAIGTGVTASAEQAQEMHAFIRKLIADKYNQEEADEISILYGGSVKPENAKEIFSQPDVDGGLIGGASLKSRDFTNIIKAFD
ncbi:triose-phosphate isomerase [Ekhidna sp. To15]|uniref:triose-phosphate isomerase n=1 Tax=Ekhidna sp. To15 TaxID=3395267 RepID=UPI003F524B3A